MYCWAWFILSVIYTIAAVRSSWILIFTLVFLDIELLLLATGYMLNKDQVLVAGNSVGFIVAFCSCESRNLFTSPSTVTYLAKLLTTHLSADWAGSAALWCDVTPLKIPTLPIHAGQ